MEDLELLNVFHAFWDAFPSPVRLIRRDRMVLAVNKAAASLGQRAGGEKGPIYGQTYQHSAAGADPHGKTSHQKGRH